MIKCDKRFLKKAGNNCYYYSKFENINVHINGTQVTCICNDIEVNVDDKLKELDDLDAVLTWVEKEYGTKAPGFEGEIEQVDKDWTEGRDDRFPDLQHDAERKLTIVTWGRRHHKKCPTGVDRDFNAGNIGGKRQGVDYRKLDGLDREVQKGVMASGTGYETFMRMVVETIERDNLMTIGIHCTAGRHRSVTCAERLLIDFYPHATIVHWDRSRK